MKQVRHIFFDLDDTLWDYETNSGKVLRELFGEYALEAKIGTAFDTFLPLYRRVNREMWREYSAGNITKQQLRDERFSNVFGILGYSDPELNAVLTREFLQRTPREKCLKEGCHEVLSALRKRYSLHIITNGFNDVQSIKIENGALAQYFQNIIVSEDHALNKPDEKIFRLAEKLSGAQEPSQCAMVGDTYESDILGALNAGWHAVYYTKDPHADYRGRVIGGLRDLLHLF